MSVSCECCGRRGWPWPAAAGELHVKPGPHRTHQRCSGPVCDRPSASPPIPSRQNHLQRRLEAVLTERNGPGRPQTAANRAEIALTGAVRTGPNTTLRLTDSVTRRPCSLGPLPSRRGQRHGRDATETGNGRAAGGKRAARRPPRK